MTIFVRVLLVIFCAGIFAACGGGEESKVDCPTATHEQNSTETVDPDCVQRATERPADDDRASGRAWKGTITTDEGGQGFTGTTNGTFSLNVASDGAVTGSGTSHSTYSTAPPIDSRITINGRRDNGSFRLALSHDPGTRIEVVAPINGTIAEAAINLTGEMGTYSRGIVRLECQDCGDGGG